MTHPRLTMLLVALLALATGCPKPKPEDDDVKDTEVETPQFDWKRQTASLQVTPAFTTLDGGELRGDASGSGVIVEPGLLVTNAHVVFRATSANGKTDSGREFQIGELLAFDFERDLALVRIEDAEARSVVYVEKPSDPLDLRLTPILAVGNTANLGLSTYRGEINNVRDLGHGEVVMHSARIGGGASGGPLYDESGEKLLGVNYGKRLDVPFSLAIPAWAVEDFVERNRDRDGVAIDDAFRYPDDVPLRDASAYEVCFEVGERKALQFPVGRATDFYVDVKPNDDSDRFVYFVGFESRGKLQSLGRRDTRWSNGGTFTAFTPGIHNLVIDSHADDRACAVVRIGKVDWTSLLSVTEQEPTSRGKRGEIDEDAKFEDEKREVAQTLTYFPDGTATHELAALTASPGMEKAKSRGANTGGAAGLHQAGFSGIRAGRSPGVAAFRMGLVAAGLPLARGYDDGTAAKLETFLIETKIEGLAPLVAEALQSLRDAAAGERPIDVEASRLFAASIRALADSEAAPTNAHLAAGIWMAYAYTAVQEDVRPDGMLQLGRLLLAELDEGPAARIAEVLRAFDDEQANAEVVESAVKSALAAIASSGGSEGGDPS